MGGERGAAAAAAAAVAATPRLFRSPFPEKKVEEKKLEALESNFQKRGGGAEEKAKLESFISFFLIPFFPSLSLFHAATERKRMLLLLLLLLDPLFW